ncbi:hypothetical protein GJ496_009723 [Pomphorhynchus laevis]|nr:hypothetical protein GJ496_009723 [Pomphorhynchus laevis]
MSNLPLLAVYNRLEQKRARLSAADKNPPAIMRMFTPSWYLDNLELHRVISSFNLFENGSNHELNLVSIARSLSNCKYQEEYGLITINTKNIRSCAVVRKRGSVVLFTYDRHDKQISDVVNEQVMKCAKKIAKRIADSDTGDNDAFLKENIRFLNFRISTMLFVLNCQHSLHLIKLYNKLRTCVMLKYLHVVYEPEISRGISVKDNANNCQCIIYASGKVCISSVTKTQAEYITSLLSPALWEFRLNS